MQFGRAARRNGCHRLLACRQRAREHKHECGVPDCASTAPSSRRRTPGHFPAFYSTGNGRFSSAIFPWPHDAVTDVNIWLNKRTWIVTNDFLRPILKSQYHASLAMLKDAIEKCPGRCVARRSREEPLLADRLSRALLRTSLPARRRRVRKALGRASIGGPVSKRTHQPAPRSRQEPAGVCQSVFEGASSRVLGDLRRSRR